MQSSKRKDCHNCKRPISQCYCDQLTRFDSNINILILRHTSESKHPFNTARICELSIKNLKVIDGEFFEDNEEYKSFLKKGPLLIFPKEGNSQLEKLESRPQSIILLDGTWKKAKKILYLNPSLQKLSSVSIGRSEKSHYLVRKSNLEGGISTLEALCEVGKVLDEKSEKYMKLEESFKRIMVKQKQYEIK